MGQSPLFAGIYNGDLMTDELTNHLADIGSWKQTPFDLQIIDLSSRSAYTKLYTAVEFWRGPLCRVEESCKSSV